MLKKLLLGLVVCAPLVGAALMFITRGTPASHPTLKTSTLPRLIPTRAFYADPRAAYDYVASHDGSHVAYKKASLTGRSIAIKNVATGKELAEFPIGINFIRWHPSQPLLRFVFEGHDWQANLKMPDRQNWTRISPLRLSGGWYKNEVATQDDMTLLTWGKSHNREAGHMWLVSQDGLTAEKIATGTDKTKYWMFDADKNPVLRLDSLDPATTRMMRKTATGWEKLIDIDLDDDFYPLSRIDADGMMTVRSARGRDKAAFAQFDSTTGAETVILANPDADVGGATALTHSGPPDLVRLGPDTFERKALTDRGEVFLKILSDFPQPVILGATSPTASGRYVTQAISPQGKSWIYLLIDLQEKSYDVLGEYYFRKFKDRLVSEQAVTFTARDGVEIPAVLTMPPDVSGPLPFIVEIHGGPAHHITLGYSHDTQFLVNRGYGVLSVNFRGSTGFGKAFQVKGFKQFGRAMQDDLADAAEWLVDQGMADPDALTAMGTSYGGYAAALAMTRDPDLFDAAIVEFPMLDVEFQSKYHPGFWENGMDGWWRYFGQVDTPEDLALMRQYSPSNHIEDLHGPILLIGGLRDQITAVQQVKDFDAAAQAAGKDVSAHYFPNADHGTNHWSDQLRRARLIEDFLATHKGGRSGGFKLVEMAPEFID